MRGLPTITNYVTIRTPISHDITLSRRIGWTRGPRQYINASCLKLSLSGYGRLMADGD